MRRPHATDATAPKCGKSLPETREAVARNAGSGCPKRGKRLSQKKWGPALLPAPTAPSEGYAGVRNLVDGTLRLTDPLSILAHQLRRRFPSHVRARRTHPAMFHGPSWVDHSCVSLRLPRSENRWKPRRARGRPTLPAPLPGWPRFHSRKSFGIACRQRSDLWSPAAPVLPFPALWRGRDRRPDHPFTMHLSSESSKRKIRRKACG
jgi:hypothetical protein